MRYVVRRCGRNDDQPTTSSEHRLHACDAHRKKTRSLRGQWIDALIRRSSSSTSRRRACTVIRYPVGSRKPASKPRVVVALGAALRLLEVACAVLATPRLSPSFPAFSLELSRGHHLRDSRDGSSSRIRIDGRHNNATVKRSHHTCHSMRVMAMIESS